MSPGTCIHFTGFHLGPGGAGCCAAGVNYEREFGAAAPGLFLRAPCVEYRVVPLHGRGTWVRHGEPARRVEVDREGRQAMPCGRRIEPTDEQVEQARVEGEADLHRVFLGLKVAAEWRVKPKPPIPRREVVECPACKGRLHLSQSAVNGHVHGRCETPKCLAWME